MGVSYSQLKHGGVFFGTPYIFRDYGELAKEDIILRTDNKRNNNRLTGASIFPTDLNLAENSQHHPWACSLRTRGYRGRHRCGVTLLSGNKISI